MESVGHDSSISTIISECRKPGIVSDNAVPCRAFIVTVQDFLFSRSCPGLQDSPYFLSGTVIGFFVRNGSWSFPLHLMRRLLLPTASTESAFANVAVISIGTKSFTSIAELIARFLPAYIACTPAPGRPSWDVTREAMMSVYTSA